jgi:hypothetical protein
MINFLILILVIVVILILLTRLRPSNSESTQYFSKNSAPKNEWGSLNGKLLWSFMSGRVQFESRKPEEFRAIYEVVLVNHIYATFEQGKSDSALKLNRPPKNEIIVDSALGPVQSWIPFNISNTIYRCGCAWGRQDENELPYATAELNESCNTLFYLTGILRKEPISKSLMPRPDMTDPEKNEAESNLEIQPHELPEIRTQTSPAPTKPVDLTKV